MVAFTTDFLVSWVVPVFNVFTKDQSSYHLASSQDFQHLLNFRSIHSNDKPIPLFNEVHSRALTELEHEFIHRSYTPPEYRFQFYTSDSTLCRVSGVKSTTITIPSYLPLPKLVVGYMTLWTRYDLVNFCDFQHARCHFSLGIQKLM